MGPRLYALKFKDVSGPPEGIPWVWLTSELIASLAWRARTIHCSRLIDFLLIEHLSHAGRENGRLIATYDQLEKFGLGRQFIAEAIRQAEALGLVEVVRGGKRNQVEDHVNRYRLTFCPYRGRTETGEVWFRPSNEWERITEKDVKEAIEDRKIRRRSKSKKTAPGSQGVTLIGVQGVHSSSAQLTHSEPQNRDLDGVSSCEHHSTSGVKAAALAAGPADSTAAPDVVIQVAVDVAPDALPTSPANVPARRTRRGAMPGPRTLGPLIEAGE